MDLPQDAWKWQRTPARHDKTKTWKTIQKKMKDTLTHDTEFEGHIDTATSNGGGAPTTRALKEFTTRATNSSRHVSLVWGSCRDHHRNVFFCVSFAGNMANVTVYLMPKLFSHTANLKVPLKAHKWLWVVLVQIVSLAKLLFFGDCLALAERFRNAVLESWCCMVSLHLREMVAWHVDGFQGFHRCPVIARLIILNAGRQPSYEIYVFVWLYGTVHPCATGSFVTFPDVEIGDAATLLGSSDTGQRHCCSEKVAALNSLAEFFNRNSLGVAPDQVTKHIELIILQSQQEDKNLVS